MIIDAHTHIVTNPWNRRDVEDFLAGADSYGIDVCCVASLGPGCYHPVRLEPSPTQEQCAAFNRDLYEVMKAFPDRIWGWVYVNPACPGAVDEVRRGIEDYGMIGVKMWMGTTCADSRVFPVVEQAIEYGVPLLQHAWDKAAGALPNESTSADIVELARRYPELKIIMAHNERAVRVIAPYPNVFVDTASPIAESGIIEKTAEWIGADRIVYGSDCIGVDFAVSWGKVCGAELSDEAKRNILGGNMLRILGRER